MLYGDPTEVLRDGGDIVELIRGKEDPHGLFGTWKNCSVPDETVEGLCSRGTMHSHQRVICLKVYLMFTC